MKQIFIGGLLMASTLLGKAQSSFSITGNMPGLKDGRMVFLYYENEAGKNRKDSCVVSDGAFHFDGTVGEPQKAYVLLSHADPAERGLNDMKYFYLEKGQVWVAGNDSVSTAIISAGREQCDYLLLEAQRGVIKNEFDALYSKATKAYYAKDTATVNKYRSVLTAMKAQIDSIQDAFILAHPDAYASLDLTALKLRTIDLSGFDPFYNKLSERVLNSREGKKLTARAEKMRGAAIGNVFDFTQPDVDGKPFKLSSLRGKYVLVDFWASWCGPCRAENPNVLKAYDKYKDKNFEVVGISLDQAKAPWVNAVQKDGLPWLQVSDLKGWKNEVAVKYGITSIPQNILVDPKGVIIAKDLRGEELAEELEKLFSKS